jgi:hypothetical protein
MNRAEFLKAVAAAHEAWSLRYGDEVPYVAADADAPPGQPSDLSIHQADRSAPPEIDDQLNKEIMRLIAEFRGD